MYILRRLISNYVFEQAEICSAWQGKNTSPATQKLCVREVSLGGRTGHSQTSPE